MPKSHLRARCAALSAAAALALAACTNGGDDVEPVSEDEAALVELSERLNSADSHAYTAEYLVDGTEGSVLVAADPKAGAAAVVVGDQTQFWVGEDEEEMAGWLAARMAGALPTDDEVSSWLTATSQDAAATAEFSDTTLAGELSDCVDVQGAADSPVGAFQVCVTTVGVLASVSAVVDQDAYEAKLKHYHDGVDTAWFEELADADGANGE